MMKWVMCLKLQCPPSFEKIVENGIKIEEALVKKGVLTLQKEGNNPSNNNNTDKLKFWKRNINIVNDGIVDGNNVKPKQPIFKLSSNTLTTNQDNNKPRLPSTNFHKKNHTYWWTTWINIKDTHCKQINYPTESKRF